MGNIPPFTLVCCVDSYHLEELSLVYPTWMKHKPSLRNVPMRVIVDSDQVSIHEVYRRIDHPILHVEPWPNEKVNYGEGKGKWENAQRYKMLSSFVHAPCYLVDTPYWLKLDTDLVATDCDDWIDPNWFVSEPAIIAHRWTFTKPPDQMEKLDTWVNEYKPPFLSAHPPLNLHPEPGASRLGHKRIISFCGFFNTEFTKKCSRAASSTVGPKLLPVHSQDGFHWYCAKRAGLPIVTPNMKSRGWSHISHRRNLVNAVRESLAK